MESLRKSLLLVAVDEAGAHLLALARVQSTGALEALVVGDALLATSHLIHVHATRVLRGDAAGVLVAQVYVGSVTLV